MYTRRCEIHLWQLGGPNAQCFTKGKEKKNWTATSGKNNITPKITIMRANTKITKSSEGVSRNCRLGNASPKYQEIDVTASYI